MRTGEPPNSDRDENEDGPVRRQQEHPTDQSRPPTSLAMRRRPWVKATPPSSKAPDAGGGLPTDLQIGIESPDARITQRLRELQVPQGSGLGGSEPR